MASMGMKPASPSRRPAPAPHGPRATNGVEVTSKQMALLVAQGTLVGCLLLAIIGGIWFFFGEALRAHMVSIGSPSKVAAPTGPGPTMIYRDRHDGTVTVMEVDGKSTRIKGTMNRSDVPLIQDEKVRNRWEDGGGASSRERIQALGSSFR